MDLADFSLSPFDFGTKSVKILVPDRMDLAIWYQNQMDIEIFWHGTKMLSGRTILYSVTVQLLRIAIPMYGRYLPAFLFGYYGHRWDQTQNAKQRLAKN